jgi:hypothetical protein
MPAAENMTETAGLRIKFTPQFRIDWQFLSARHLRPTLRDTSEEEHAVSIATDGPLQLKMKLSRPAMLL